MKILKTLFNKEDFRTLFLGVAFPLHIWAILLVMRDFEWIVERSNNMMDGIGVAAYALVFTLLESLIITLLLTLIGSVFPRRWSRNQRNSVLLSSFFIALLWGMAGQAVAILEFNPLPEPLLRFLIQTGHPLRYLTLAGMTLIGGSVLLTIWAGWRSDKFQRGLMEFVSRATPITILYLILDGIAIVIVIVRNLLRAFS